jgi:hypothetical protein
MASPQVSRSSSFSSWLCVSDSFFIGSHVIVLGYFIFFPSFHGLLLLLGFLADVDLEGRYGAKKSFTFTDLDNCYFSRFHSAESVTELVYNVVPNFPRVTFRMPFEKTNVHVCFQCNFHRKCRLVTLTSLESKTQAMVDGINKSFFSELTMVLQSPLEDLKETLAEIAANDANYPVREKLVYRALAEAVALGYKAGIRFDTDDKDAAKWPVVCIMLPDIGEVSWHCPAYDMKFTGYDTAEKYRRIAQFVGKRE